jgi:pimeloyl-ACP methyl ester carboxylesterase
MQRWRLWLIASLVAMGGCARFLPAPVPMRAVDYPASPTARAKCLVVFLPGMGDDAEDFEKNGFVEEVRRRGLSIDMVAAQATIGYYSRGTFTERLAVDVVAPRRARGYAQTWLIGMSMGGFGTLYYSHQHLDDVSGVLALAPYLGDKDLIEEIHQAGGLQKWGAPARVPAMNEDNYQREMWRWLQAATRGAEPAPKINVAFGRQDKLIRADELLAAELPKEHVFLTEGGHNWGPWRTLLAQFLDQGEMGKVCR